jgi:hypothetical protein
VYSGADVYQEWIAICEPFLVSIGDSLQLEVGHMIGPTAAGLEYLMELDPSAEWDTVTGTVINSAFPISPRIIAIGTFDPRFGKHGCGLGGTCLTVAKFLVIFLQEPVAGHECDMVVRLMEVLIPRKGDTNADGEVDIADVMYLINYIFIGGSPPQPMEAGDCNCDGVVDVADVIYLINYLFLEGPPPRC